MTNKVRHYIATTLLASVLLMFASCSKKSNNVSEYVSLPNHGWAYNDTLAFPLNFPDSTATGDLSIAIDHEPTYRYRNVWLEVSYASPDESDRTLHRDTMEMVLCDSAGNWVGTGLASTLQLTGNPVKVTLDKRHPITIRHIMRTDTLRNLNRIGIFFIADQQNND